MVMVRLWRSYIDRDQLHEFGVLYRGVYDYTKPIIIYRLYPDNTKSATIMVGKVCLKAPYPSFVFTDADDGIR